MKYQTPSVNYLRLHHVRPRFKNNIENVLIYVATLISQIGITNKTLFRQTMIEKLREFPGNANLSKKTLENWRTEISALFGLYYEDNDNTYPSEIAIDLYANQDLTKFFKYFLYSFQYPGGHIKSQEIKFLLESRICFNPARYFLNIIKTLENIKNGSGYLTKGEACHLIFNNKIATTDPKLQQLKFISNLIIKNRNDKILYDLSGDVIRYAGDILDYMVLANLLKDYAGKFFINKSEKRSIDKFLSNNNYFDINFNNLKNYKLLEENWIQYCSMPAKKMLFETDVLASIAKDDKEYQELQKRMEYLQSANIPSSDTRTKDIGDYGEHLIYGHECAYLKINNRIDLISWVKCIPNHFAVGYDIQSVNLEEVKKYIEVKTTISSKKLTFNKIHLTKNELSSAQTLKENYYIYRIQIIKGEKAEEEPILNLRIFKDPIGLFKKDLIEIDLATGDVILKKYEGEEVRVLKYG